jgi:hypothetical protein
MRAWHGGGTANGDLGKMTDNDAEERMRLAEIATGSIVRSIIAEQELVQHVIRRVCIDL